MQYNPDRQLHAVSESEPKLHVCHVALDGANAELELMGDFLVPESVRHKAPDPTFVWAQHHQAPAVGKNRLHFENQAIRRASARACGGVSWRTLKARMTTRSSFDRAPSSHIVPTLRR
jgi:hypothetical protein